MKFAKVQKNLYLQQLSSSWLASPFKDSIRSYCAYEKKPTLGVLVVPRTSATALCNQRLDPINDNHYRVVKPVDTSADSYIMFKVAYEETFERSRVVDSERAITITGQDTIFSPEPWPMLIADSVDFRVGTFNMPDRSLIIANDVNLQDAVLRGKNFAIVAATLTGGVLDASGREGESGGELLVSAARIRGTKLLARGGDGAAGPNGTDGQNGSGGANGRNGKCGAGSYQSAHAGADGSPGTDGTNGSNGGDGGNGGNIYIVSLASNIIQTDVSGGNAGQSGVGGRGGRGSAGGKGGSGCTGLGGSQSSKSSGAPGQDGVDGITGRDGRQGRDGTIWKERVGSLIEIVKDIPDTASIPDYADDIVSKLKNLARGIR